MLGDVLSRRALMAGQALVKLIANNNIATELQGVVLIEPEVYSDARGYFLETFNARDFAEAGISEQFVQDNQSHSNRGVLRGLHYQQEQAQGKLIRVL